MIHPNAQINRNIFDIDECFDAVVDLLLREYNKDMHIRSPFLPMLKAAYKSIARDVVLPSIQVDVMQVRYPDAPQDTGAMDCEIDFQVTYMAGSQFVEKQVKESYDAAEALRAIVAINKSIPNREATKGHLFSTVLRENVVDFSEVLVSFDGDKVLSKTAKFTFTGVFGEEGY